MNHVNLLPEEWLRRLLIRRRVRGWIGIWLFVSIVCLAASATIFAMQANQRAHYYTVREAARPVQLVAEQVRQLHARLAVLEGRESLLATLESASHPFQMLGIVNESAETEIGQLQITEFTISSSSSSASQIRRSSNQRKRSSPSESVAEEVELMVTGTASDDIAITQFVSQLRSYNVFDQVVLHSSQIAKDGSDRTFRVGCKFRK